MPSEAESVIRPPLRRAFRLNGMEVRPEALRLGDAGRSCRIEPKVMTLLVVLAERPGELWTRDMLVERIWGGASASDESLTRLVYQLRRGLKNAGDLAHLVRTVSRLGYRLDGDVVSAAPRSDRRALTEEPFPPFSVAVMPLADLSEDGNGRLLTDGLMRDLTMLLARIPRFRIAAPSSVDHCVARVEDPMDLARALHSRFLVTGTLARYEHEVVVRIELIDAVDGVLIWSDRQSSSFDRFFELEEDVVCGISTAIATAVHATQPLRVRRAGRFNLTAYERIQAAELLRAEYGRETARAIVEMLEEALRLEPDDPMTRAALAVQLSQNVVSQWADDPRATIERADALIAEALASAPSDPQVLASAGIVATMFHRPDDAIRQLELATACNPNDAHARAVLGWQHCLRHADSAGIGLIEDAERQAPHHPRFGLWATYRATGHLFLQQHAEGLTGALDAIERTPKYYQPYLTCAWAHAGLHQLEDARERIRQAQAMESDDILEKYVAEMREWSSNSPHREATWVTLDVLTECRSIG